jgi:hypothetical protein
MALMACKRPIIDHPGLCGAAKQGQDHGGVIEEPAGWSFSRLLPHFHPCHEKGKRVFPFCRDGERPARQKALQAHRREGLGQAIVG